MKIKICGLFRSCDIDFVNEAKPDYIGFVFAKSKRQIDFKTAYDFKSKLSPKIKAVGVFVNENSQVVNEAVENKIIDIVQLHGTEDENYIKTINAPVIKALKAGEYQPQNADFYLFDSAVPGSGKTFDWSKLERAEKPYFLAGGINLENIDKAVQLKPYCIDISSGAETDGFKDKNKIIELVRRVKNV